MKEPHISRQSELEENDEVGEGEAGHADEVGPADLEVSQSGERLGVPDILQEDQYLSRVL